MEISKQLKSMIHKIYRENRYKLRSEYAHECCIIMDNKELSALDTPEKQEERRRIYNNNVSDLLEDKESLLSELTSCKCSEYIPEILGKHGIILY